MEWCGDYALCRACVKLIQSGLDKRDPAFRIPSLELPLSFHILLRPFSFAALWFLILPQMAKQRGKKMDFVGTMMGCLMLEVVEELRERPFLKEEVQKWRPSRHKNRWFSDACR